MEIVNLRFFNINRCGYYLPRRRHPEFSGTIDVLSSLKAWATDGREFINTTTYQEDLDKNIRNTFFCGCSDLDGKTDAVLTLWTEIPSDNGKIYGMNPLDLPGGTSMQTTGFGRGGAIPGLPSYFWFVPQHGVFATVRFSHSVQGKGNLENYLLGYMANKSPYRVINRDNAVIGFSTSGSATSSSDRVIPRFESTGVKNTDLETELLSNLHKIRRMIKRETLEYQSADNRSMLEQLFSGLLPAPPPTHHQKRQISHDIQFEPNEEELRTIIDNYLKRDVESKIRNVGFVYNDGGRVMLNGIGVTMEIELPITRRDTQMISPDTLLDALSARRQDLLRPLGN